MSVGKITEFVDQVGFDNLDKTVQKLGLVKQEIIETISLAKLYADSISGAKTMAEFNERNQLTIQGLEKVQAVKKTISETEKSIAAQTDALVNKTRDNLIAAEQKKQEAAEKTLNKYLQNQSKQGVALEAQMNKEIALAEQKAAKLKAISDKSFADAERKANVQFPIGSSLGGIPVTQEPTNPTPRYEPIITGNENMAITATKSAEATAAQSLALAEQKEVMDGLSVSYRSNIELLLSLQLERAANTKELKALNIEDAVSGERAVFLTAEQLKLKTAIAQTNLTLSQQTKQMLAADTSTVQMQAQLDELRVAYNNLTLAEQQNIEIGGVWLAEIETLDLAVKEAAISQGIYNKNVGNYAVVAQLAERETAQVVRQLIRMGAQFLIITVAFGAITWLYDFIKGLDVFTGRLDKATQNLNALNDVMKDADQQAGKQITNLKLLYQSATDVNNSTVERTKSVIELKKEFPDTFKALKTEAILNGEASDSYKKLSDEILKNAVARAAVTKIQQLAGTMNDIEFQKQKIRDNYDNKIRDFKSRPKFDNSNPNEGRITTDDLMQDATNKAHQDLADLDKSGIVVKNQIDYLIKRAGGVNKLASSITDNKPGKPEKPKKEGDRANTDLLEFQRIQITEAKKQQQAILDNDNQTYAAKIVALGVYRDRSKQLIANAENIALADTNLREQQRINIIAKFKLEGDAVDIEIADKKQQLDKEALAKHKQTLSELVTADKEAQQEQLEALGQGAITASQILQDSRDAQLEAKNQAYDKGKITEQQYNRDILAINDKYAIDRLNQELVVQNAILAIKTATRDKEISEAKANGATQPELDKITSEANKGIDTTGNAIASIGGQLKNAVNKKKRDDLAGDKKTAKEKAKDALEFAEKAVQGLEIAGQLIAQNTQAKIDALEREFALIERNSEFEKNRINGSLLSSKEKARQTAIIDIQTAQQRERITLLENQAKKKQAEFDKALAIARIIQGTAVAIVEVLGNPFLVAIVAALGAAQLAVAVASPIPQFEKGGTVKKDGNIITGEAGTELRIDPSGKTSFTADRANVSYAKAGTKIISNAELVKMLGKPEQLQYVVSATNDNKKMEKLLTENNDLLRKQKSANIHIHGDKWGSYSQQRNY
jgi:hypothetical protein